ncbi:beta-ketoacyl-ACP synthase 3 [Saccharopolyspora sp. NPDC047091]|uniref:beta-ketoacyl-ACP synthase 3 n=1 Tax=Saccharopolyspora sp. NPDC047091 TaxID=3155924 RepID=UPI0033F4A976
MPGGSAGSQVVALGHHLPATVVTTGEVADRIGVDEQWIVSRTGIRERRMAAEDETVADLATAAARAALDALAADARYAEGRAGIDAVIVATSTAESAIPNVAGQVAARAGLGHPAAFDVNTACSGFCYALAIADALIRAGTSRGALVVGADKATAWLDWDDWNTGILFGDGAGAVVVLPHDRPAVGPVLWGSIGEQGELISIDPQQRVLRQEGRSVFRWATGLDDLVREVCARAGLELGDLVGFVPHQANLRIVDSFVRKLGLDEIRTATDVIDAGNTIAATIPVALSRMRAHGEFGAGGPVLLFGFGAGLSYAGQVITLPPANPPRSPAPTRDAAPGS